MSAAEHTPYLTLEEAADYLRLDSSEWLRERARGVGTKLGKRWVFRTDHLDSWYDRLLAEESACPSTDEKEAGSGTSESGEASIGARGRLHELRPSP